MSGHWNGASEETFRGFQRRADAMKRAVLNAPVPAPESFFPKRCAGGLLCIGKKGKNVLY